MSPDRGAILRALELVIAHLADGRRVVLRALADHLVAALARVADPSGRWAESGSEVGIDAGSPERIATALSGERVRTQSPNRSSY